MERKLRVNTKELALRSKFASYDALFGGIMYLPLNGVDGYLRGPLVHPSYMSVDQPVQPLLQPNTPAFNILSHAGNIPEGFLLGGLAFALADATMKSDAYSWKKTLTAGGLAFAAGSVLEMTWPGQTPDINDIWAFLPGIMLFSGMRRFFTSIAFGNDVPRGKERRLFYLDKK